MRDRPDALMLFAAGLGTRMLPLTADRPKPLVEVAGRPLIDHALDHIRDLGQLKVAVNLHYRAEMLQRHLDGTGVVTIVEQPEILDTGGGLRNALPVLGGGPVFTFNSDAIWTGANPLVELAQAWEPDHMDALLLLVPLATATAHAGKGDFIPDAEGRLTRGPGLVYGGAQILKTDGLAEIAEPRFSLNLLWDRMAAEGRLYGTVHAGRWCDVGRPSAIPLAEAMLARGAAHA